MGGEDTKRPNWYWYLFKPTLVSKRYLFHVKTGIFMVSLRYQMSSRYLYRTLLLVTKLVNIIYLSREIVNSTKCYREFYVKVLWPKLPEKKGMKHNKQEHRESVSECGRFKLNECYYWFIQKKKFYEVTSEFERRLCEKDLK